MELLVFLTILALIFYFTIPVEKKEYIQENDDDKDEDAGIILMDDML